MSSSSGRPIGKMEQLVNENWKFVENDLETLEEFLENIEEEEYGVAEDTKEIIREEVEINRRNLDLGVASDKVIEEEKKDEKRLEQAINDVENARNEILDILNKIKDDTELKIYLGLVAVELSNEDKKTDGKLIKNTLIPDIKDFFNHEKNQGNISASEEWNAGRLKEKCQKADRLHDELMDALAKVQEAARIIRKDMNSVENIEEHLEGNISGEEGESLLEELEVESNELEHLYKKCRELLTLEREAGTTPTTGGNEGKTSINEESKIPGTRVNYSLKLLGKEVPKSAFQ